MLNFPLLHPQLISALAAAGHGSKILVGDGNYPFSTGGNPAAPVVYLNLRPGLIGVDDILATIVQAVPIESAAVMVPADGATVPAHEDYRATLGADVAWVEHDRFAFYDASRGADVAVIVASGDQRVFANILLTIGVRSAG